MRQALLAIAFGMAAAAQTGVIDRVAVVVGNQVITASEVELEVRLTEFLNGAPLDLGAAARKAAAERLVDQQLIRNEMQAIGYAAPAAAVPGNFPREKLEKYGVTEDDVRRHLLWQAAALQFTDERFHMSVTEPQSADRAADGDGGTEDPMVLWLRDARKGTRIVFKEAAFQ